MDEGGGNSVRTRSGGERSCMHVTVLRPRAHKARRQDPKQLPPIPPLNLSTSSRLWDGGDQTQELHPGCSDLWPHSPVLRTLGNWASATVHQASRMEDGKGWSPGLWRPTQNGVHPPKSKQPNLCGRTLGDVGFLPVYSQMASVNRRLWNHLLWNPLCSPQWRPPVDRPRNGLWEWKDLPKVTAGK